LHNFLEIVALSIGVSLAATAAATVRVRSLPLQRCSQIGWFRPLGSKQSGRIK
jgi:hypothetical protein